MLGSQLHDLLVDAFLQWWARARSQLDCVKARDIVLSRLDLQKILLGAALAG